MDLNQGLVDLVTVALVAALAPLVVAVLPGPRIPQVVILLFGGVLIGPHVLGLAETSSIQLLANIGLGFLFLLAGYELDPRLFRQRPGKLAILGWLISAVLAVGVTAGLGAFGYVKDYVPVGLALTTTALGTLLPILRDNDMLGGPFGQYVYAAGAAGELFPILIIALFLTERGNFIALASVALVGALAIVLSAAPWLARSSTVQRIIREGQDATGQTTLRWAIACRALPIATTSVALVPCREHPLRILRTGSHHLPVDHDPRNDRTPATRCAIGIKPVAVSLSNAPPTATPSSVIGRQSGQPHKLPGGRSGPRMFTGCR